MFLPGCISSPCLRAERDRARAQARRGRLSGAEVRDRGGTADAPVHLNIVLASSPAVSQRTPWPARHPASGPWPTSLVHRKPPADLAKPVPGLYAPPPVRKAAPVGKPLMPAALKPKPVLPPAAHAGDATRTTAAASTAGTNAMIFLFIFIFQPSLPAT